MKKQRRKDAASFQLQFCFSGDDLLRYRTGKVPSELRSQIFYHLNVEECQRCRNLCLTVQGLRQDTSSVEPNQRMIDRLQQETGTYMAPPVPLRLQKGQIWTTSAQPRNRRGEVVAAVVMAVPVLIMSSGNGGRSLENKIRVLPLSNDMGFHLAGETLALHDDSPLNYPILVEIFNESPMLGGNLGEYRGSVSKSQLREIQMLRDRYLDGPIAIKPDKPYLKWKQKEMEMTRYLSFPVNEAIWADTVETGGNIAETGTPNATVVDLFLMPYKKAADADGVDLSELRPHILMEEDAFTLAIVQKGDRVLLRFVSDSLIPEIFMDDEKIPMDKKADGLLEAVLGYSAEMPEAMTLKGVIAGNRFVFHLRFRESRDA